VNKRDINIFDIIAEVSHYLMTPLSVLKNDLEILNNYNEKEAFNRCDRKIKDIITLIELINCVHIKSENFLIELNSCLIDKNRIPSKTLSFLIEILKKLVLIEKTTLDDRDLCIFGQVINGKTSLNLSEAFINPRTLEYLILRALEHVLINHNISFNINTDSNPVVKFSIS
jgi:signal transduction histidine kinase